ncbi:MAG: hotdog domain-containing protein [Mariprofundaceae bacterium]|nr:hotdog domain-containing protein [Mariprofundaceae bacterium]
MKPVPMSASRTLIDAEVTRADLNAHGLMHGGRLMTICDEAGYLAACKHCGTHGLTRAAHRLRFHAPMHERDRFSVTTQVTMTTRTTMWVNCNITSHGKQIMDAVFVYVAIDENLKPAEVPGLLAGTDEEKKMMQETERLYSTVMAGEGRK